MAKSQFQINQEIEAFIKDKDSRKESYSADDIAFINQYTGSGGQGSKGATGEGLLYEFYTPDYVVDLMWDLARNYGYNDKGFVLEPSIATGRLIRPAKDYSKCVGFEINPVTARIAEINYPQALIYRGYFETAFLQAPRFTSRLKGKQFTWLQQYPFDLVIGNPPYGIHKNQYSSYFPELKKLHQIENFFMYQGMKMLRSGGLLVYLTSSNFMQNGEKYNIAKEMMQEFTELVDAYRLPPVMDETQVPVDILVFRKK